VGMLRTMRRNSRRYSHRSRRHRKARRPDIRFTRDDRPKGSPADPLSRWPAFVAAVRARLDIGQQEYGHRSFSRPVEELTKEIEEELFDVCAWTYILWTRIHLGTAAKRRIHFGRQHEHSAPSLQPPQGSRARKR
jgi:hypothetical protein